MSNIVEAEYQIVQERTLPVIIGEIKIIEQKTLKAMLEGYIEIGQRLQEAKEQIRHGEFDTWCKENLNYTRRTAENFMRIAREYGGENGLISKTKMSSHLSVSNALSLLKLPEEDREKFIEDHPVEDMTNKALEAEIRKLKKEKATLEEEVTRVAKDRSEIDGRLSETEAEVEQLKGQLAAATYDSGDLENLRSKLEKAEEKARKAREELKKEKEGRQAAIDQAIGNQKQAYKEEARKEAEAELTEAKKNISELVEKIDQLEKRAANAGDEKKVRFKILMDQLQDTFGEAKACVVQELDPEMQEKMTRAMSMVIEKFRQEVQD